MRPKIAVWPCEDDETQLMLRGAELVHADRASDMMLVEEEVPVRAPEMVFVGEKVPGRAPEMVSGRLLPTRGGLRTPFRTLRQAFATKPISGPKRKDCNRKIPVLVFCTGRSKNQKKKSDKNLYLSFIKSHLPPAKRNYVPINQLST